MEKKISKLRERDERICQHYREGSTQAELANRFHISKVRVGQILAKAKVTKDERPKPNPASNFYSRNAFVGIHLPVGLKAAVKKIGEEEETSVSRVICEILEEEMERRGITVVEPVQSNEIDMPLPLEG